MSVVGPRPHMELHTWDYEDSIDKYLVRRFVKPGITGLARIKGFRGEITQKNDILHRVGLALDLKIISETISHVILRE